MQANTCNIAFYPSIAPMIVCPMNKSCFGMFWLREFQPGTGLTQTIRETTQDRSQRVQEQHHNNIAAYQSGNAGTQAYPQ